jgi:hypothetical protein
LPLNIDRNIKSLDPKSRPTRAGACRRREAIGAGAASEPTGENIHPDPTRPATARQTAPALT